MNCDQATRLVSSYVDGELDAASILEFEQHIKTCAACAMAVRSVQGLQKAVRQETLYFTAPAALRKNVRLALREHGEPQRERSKWKWNWLTSGLAGAAIGCVAVLLTLNLAGTSPERRLAQELVSNHVRSMMVNHALDVVSTDQHTVKPWFNGKLDFSPPVKDFAAQEFTLIGGRLDYLDGHTVAALVYQHHKHIINLFVWPAKESDSMPGAIAPIQGFNLIHWSSGGMNFWLVSDLNEKELEEFAKMFAS